MVTIDQRGNRSWRARVRLPGYKLKTRTLDTRAQAEIWAERIERELHIGNDTIPNAAGSAQQKWHGAPRHLRHPTLAAVPVPIQSPPAGSRPEARSPRSPVIDPGYPSLADIPVRRTTRTWCSACSG
jgi:hypothetical protein